MEIAIPPTRLVPATDRASPAALAPRASPPMPVAPAGPVPFEATAGFPTRASPTPALAASASSASSQAAGSVPLRPLADARLSVYRPGTGTGGPGGATGGAKQLVPVVLDSHGVTGDPIADRAIRNVRQVDGVLAARLGRNGIDGRGGGVGIVVHASDPRNAYWSARDNAIELGSGDGELFAPLGDSLSVVAHELYHGVIDSEVRLDYTSEEQGAVHESLADVFAATVTGSWRVAEDVYTPKQSGDALRDMASPRIAHMRDANQAGGQAHYLSGIPSLAAVRASSVLGLAGLQRTWYVALTRHLADGADIAEAARATVAAAAELYGSSSRELSAVADAWRSVGVEARWTTARFDPAAAPAWG